MASLSAYHQRGCIMSSYFKGLFYQGDILKCHRQQQRVEGFRQDVFEGEVRASHPGDECKTDCVHVRMPV